MKALNLRRVLRLVPRLVTLCSVLSACSSDAVPTAPTYGGTAPVYTFATAGDRNESGSGTSFTRVIPNGWREQDNGGAISYSSDVVLISFASISDLGAPQASIGLLAAPRIGTYRVRVPGAPFGQTPEFYASYRVLNADSTSTVFTATSGSITLTDVSPVMRGTFRFHASRAATWPASMPAGITVTDVPASLDVTGVFVARIP